MQKKNSNAKTICKVLIFTLLLVLYAHQDIFNVFAFLHPERVADLPCSWNFQFGGNFQCECKDEKGVTLEPHIIHAQTSVSDISVYSAYIARHMCQLYAPLETVSLLSRCRVCPGLQGLNRWSPCKSCSGIPYTGVDGKCELPARNSITKFSCDALISDKLCPDHRLVVDGKKKKN